MLAKANALDMKTLPSFCADAVIGFIIESGTDLISLAHEGSKTLDFSFCRPHLLA